RIQQLDRDLRQQDSKGVEAVGILGSDLYDKLLVLQALRPLVPNALFFTTDLDALVLHPTALTYTRNLLVASSFALPLRPAAQGRRGEGRTPAVSQQLPNRGISGDPHRDPRPAGSSCSLVEAPHVRGRQCARGAICEPGPVARRAIPIGSHANR